MVSPWYQYSQGLEADALRRVVIATPTFYRNTDDLRFKLACETIANATKAGYPIIVVDGSPDPSIGNKFIDLGAQVHREITRGLGRVKRYSFYQAIRYAEISGRSIVVHLEPEKSDMIRHVPFLVETIINGEADVTVATRGDESWLSYPEFQVQTERDMNTNFRNAIGIDVDIAVGPGAFEVTKAGYFFVDGCYAAAGIADTYAQHYGVIAAHAHGLRVAASVPLDFLYPAQQRAQEEAEIAAGGDMKEKRLAQLKTLSDAYVALGAHFKLPR